MLGGLVWLFCIGKGGYDEEVLDFSLTRFWPGGISLIHSIGLQGRCLDTEGLDPYSHDWLRGFRVVCLTLAWSRNSLLGARIGQIWFA